MPRRNRKEVNEDKGEEDKGEFDRSVLKYSRLMDDTPVAAFMCVLHFQWRCGR